MVYEPLYHARGIATTKLSSGPSSTNISKCFNKTIFPLSPVGYEMIISIITYSTYGREIIAKSLCLCSTYVFLMYFLIGEDTLSGLSLAIYDRFFYFHGQV